MSDAAFGNSRAGGDPVEPVEVARDVADPSQPPADAAPAPQAAAPRPDAEPAAPTPRQDTDRAAIANRFKGRRTEHDAQHKPQHVPPFVEAAAEAGALSKENGQEITPNPLENNAQGGGDRSKEIAQPAPSYTLKVRGKDIAVDRAELLRLADVEAHEEKDFDDARLIRYAQKNAAADMRLDLARQAHEQARAAAPAPAGPQAGAPTQQPAPQPEAPADLPALARDYHEKLQYGSPDEATAAWQALEAAKDQQRAAHQAGQTREAALANEGSAAVEAFKTANPELVGKPLVQKAMVMQVAEEIENDLRAAGLTDEHLAGATGNPAAMDHLYRLARQSNVPVRSQHDLLQAAGQKVREGLGLPPLATAPAPVAPPSSAAPTRLDEKRGLPAQPMRSGNPPPVAPPRVDQTTSRKAAIAQMQRSRTAPNVPSMAG